MKIIHLIFLLLVGFTRITVDGNTAAEDELYRIIEEVVYQEITTIVQRKTTTLLSGPSVDVKKPGVANEIWNLKGSYTAESQKGPITMKVKFVDCWDGAFKGIADVGGYNGTAKGTWFENGDLVFVMSYNTGYVKGLNFISVESNLFSSDKLILLSISSFHVVPLAHELFAVFSTILIRSTLLMCPIITFFYTYHIKARFNMRYVE